VLYFEWRNVTRERCCELCAANATCAFALHRASDGMCWPSPPSASGWQAGKAGITTCRTTAAPPWPQPPARLALWPMVRGEATAGEAQAAFASDFRVECAGDGCPSVDWYQGRIRASAAHHAALGQAEAPNGTTLGAVSVLVDGPGSAVLRTTMNESYSLRCAGAGCTVHAAETVGAVRTTARKTTHFLLHYGLRFHTARAVFQLRGLETLAHLAHAGPLPMPLTIEDSPRFPNKAIAECAPPAVLGSTVTGGGRGGVEELAELPLHCQPGGESRGSEALRLSRGLAARRRLSLCRSTNRA